MLKMEIGFSVLLSDDSVWVPFGISVLLLYEILVRNSCLVLCILLRLENAEDLSSLSSSGVVVGLAWQW